MYYIHEEYRTPDRDTVIWHYFSLSKFLSLLNDKKLYFNRSDLFYDTKEGEISELDKNMLNSYSSDITYRIENNGLGYYYVHCWVMYQEELYLMWNTYSSLEEGVAIKTTIGDLINSLDPNDPREIIISDVRYMDYENDYTFEKTGGIVNLLAPLFCKRRYFSQEKELRLVYHNHSMRLSENDKGVLFDVNLDKLINEIWVAPDATEWFYNLIDKEIKLHGISKPVLNSNIRSK